MPNKTKLRFTALAASIQGSIEKAKKAVALEILKNAVFATPVDTGRARSNWFVGVGEPNTTKDTTIDPGANKNPGFPGTFEKGKNVILLSPTFLRDIYISNNLPYIGKLNAGSSDQAPAGFVERAVQSGVNTIRNIKL